MLCPNRLVSPLSKAPCLSDRASRERHCDRDYPPEGGLSSFWFSHRTTTSLFPFAPPRFAARLHRYYGNSDFCRTLQPACSDVVDSLPVGHNTMPTRPGPFILERSPLPVSLDADCPRPSSDRSLYLSRLTFLPFRPQPPHRHFSTIGLARYITVVDHHVYPWVAPEGQGNVPRAV